MAVIINIDVPGKGVLEFDFTNSLITASNTIDSLTAQELANAIRDAEDELREVAIAFDGIAIMSGKADIGDVYTAIVIELLNDWQIVSGKSSGSFIVQDGTVIRTATAGQIFAINNNVSQINLMAQAGVIATVAGSTVTWDDALTDHRQQGTFGEAIRKILHKSQ
jgi:hypothetical protein